ncbi:hypothetical protein SeMB42_g03041 [Synchytrium endobioticum]|uniref:Bromo domain-containing protein n=1 Tax=Synchytrium endobioticum TaxID=286115 RepID=A0A507DBN4_9FUNG|nr:hypothetical protein SeLEV6574_g02407 [Synchytrium endobioticum]TPX48320.1 hypothetical protein SeMB42_g03041 [Synchytrium endobioticum]
MATNKQKRALAHDGPALDVKHVISNLLYVLMGHDAAHFIDRKTRSAFCHHDTAPGQDPHSATLDLQTLLDRNLTAHYSSLTHFQNDLEAMFSSILQVFKPTSKVYAAAARLRDQSVRLIHAQTQLMPTTSHGLPKRLKPQDADQDDVAITKNGQVALMKLGQEPSLNLYSSLRKRPGPASLDLPPGVAMVYLKPTHAISDPHTLCDVVKIVEKPLHTSVESHVKKSGFNPTEFLPEAGPFMSYAPAVDSTWSHVSTHDSYRLHKDRPSQTAQQVLSIARGSLKDQGIDLQGIFNALRLLPQAAGLPLGPSKSTVTAALRSNLDALLKLQAFQSDRFVAGVHTVSKDEQEIANKLQKNLTNLMLHMSPREMLLAKRKRGSSFSGCTLTTEANYKGIIPPPKIRARPPPPSQQGNIQQQQQGMPPQQIQQQAQGSMVRPAPGGVVNMAMPGQHVGPIAQLSSSLSPYQMPGMIPLGFRPISLPGVPSMQQWGMQ